MNMEPQLYSGLLWKQASHNETLKGYPFIKHKYPEEGRHIVVAWQTLKHDELSNKNWSKSTIENFIMVAEDAKLRVPGDYNSRRFSILYIIHHILHLNYIFSII